MKQIARDVIGELLETGRQTGRQMSAVPGQVTKGVKPVATSAPAKKSEQGSMPRVGMPNLEKLGGQKGQGNSQLTQMIQQDNQNRQQGIDNVRQQLTQVKIKRYKEIQQEIEKERRKKEEEVPAYEAGKPGTARTKEEQLEMQEKQAKEAKNQSGEMPMPQGKKPRGSMFFAKQRKGSGEIKLGKQG